MNSIADGNLIVDAGQMKIEIEDIRYILEGFSFDDFDI